MDREEAKAAVRRLVESVADWQRGASAGRKTKTAETKARNAATCPEPSWSGQPSW